MEGREKKQQQRDKGSAGADGPTERKQRSDCNRVDIAPIEGMCRPWQPKKGGNKEGRPIASDYFHPRLPLKPLV